MEILVARQPVFDRREQLYGYTLMLRSPGGADVPGEPPPERLVADAFLGIGLDQVTGGRCAFLTVDEKMLMSGAVKLLPPDRVVLQLSGAPDGDRELLQACNELVGAGYRFSVDVGRLDALPEEYLRIARIARVDVAAIDRPMIAELADRLREFRVQMLATNVRHRTERDVCTGLGFELFEGYGFAAPETVTCRDLPIEHVLTFRLMKMVRDPKSTDVELEDVLRRDVALSYKLLRMVNSAAVGGRDIWSIGHALRLLGREQVARWLALLLVTDATKDGVRAELMNQALVRARMCELLADASGVPPARGSLFLVGMLSLLDQLLETPMDVLIESMELAPDVRAALLRREEFFGEVLGLVEAYEKGRWDRVDALAASVGVSPTALAPNYIEALRWANEHQARNSAHEEKAAAR